jgi:ankyrin repeat protein
MPIAVLTLLLSLTAHAASNPERPSRMQAIPAPRGPCSGYDLFEAISARDPKCLEKSLPHMSINEVDRDGDTPLHAAIRLRSARAVSFFLKKGANLRKENFEHLTPRGLAEEYGFRRLAEHLAKIEFETDRLDTAVEDGDLEAVKSSLRRGASIGSRNVRADNPLHRAAMGGFADVGRALIAAGVDINAKNFVHETPLVTAILRGHEDFAEMLLNAGANPNVVDTRNETALDLADVRGLDKIVKLLTAKGAKHGSPANAEFGWVGGGGGSGQ